MSEQNAWQNRITGYGEEAPDQLLANPRNARRHPAAQREALRGLLSEVGVIQNVIVNRTTGYVLDGHARIEEALSAGQPMIPVTYVDLAESEEALVLAAFDGTTGLATWDAEAYSGLLADIETSSAGLQAMLAGQAGALGILVSESIDKAAPAEFSEYGDDLETQYRCPQCAYEWSGKPK